MRILIHVQHLLGIGHLQRALLLADGLAQTGFRIDLVSGGMPTDLDLPPTMTFHQLPPLRSEDGHFERLLDERDGPIDARWQQRRKRQLLELYAAVSPSVLITETFPFGRRMLRFELIPLLEAARASQTCRLIVASIRDILQPKSKPERNAEIVDLIERYYDRVLVHGDAALAPLAHSFAAADAIADKISYSGYIRQPARPVATDLERAEVLVSAGGSATGLGLLRHALAARPLSRLADCRWRILVSPAIEMSHFEALRALAGDGVVVERNRRDFSGLLQTARLSISQAGYNTVTDILASSTPAVLVPFAEADEIEQSLRAGILQQNRRAIRLDEKDLSPQSLALAIDRALEQTGAPSVALDGAAESARLLREWLQPGHAAR